MLSAHLDHLGIGEPINGDRIYNGAMDNGSGSALVLDIANSLHRSHATLKRSVLFVWVTAEEKGLLGSRYFATHPTVPKTSMVADINTDMFLPIFPLKVLTVYGLTSRALETWRGRWQSSREYRFSLTPNRCAMPLFAAINTASFDKEFQRWR